MEGAGWLCETGCVKVRLGGSASLCPNTGVGWMGVVPQKEGYAFMHSGGCQPGGALMLLAAMVNREDGTMVHPIMDNGFSDGGK